MRFERDISDIGQGIGNALDDAANAIGDDLCNTYGGKNFLCECAPWCFDGYKDRQFGTKWIGFWENSFAGLFNESLTTDKIDLLYYLCVVQLILAIIPSLLACLSRCCGDDSHRADKKAAAGGASNTLTVVLIGIFGLCAIFFNCKELLMACVITALISIVLTILYLLIMLCGLCQLCRTSDGCCDAFGTLCVFLIGLVWVAAAFIINIAICVTAWPFVFDGKSMEDSLDDLTDN